MQMSKCSNKVICFQSYIIFVCFTFSKLIRLRMDGSEFEIFGDSMLNQATGIVIHEDAGK